LGFVSRLGSFSYRYCRRPGWHARGAGMATGRHLSVMKVPSLRGGQKEVIKIVFTCADLTACGRFINTAKRGDSPFLRKQKRVFYARTPPVKQQLTGRLTNSVKALVGRSALYDPLAQRQ